MTIRQFTVSEVLDIRRTAKSVSQTLLASTLDVSRKTIYNIVTKAYYSNVPDPKTLNSYPSYEIYPDGRVLSTRTDKFVKQSLSNLNRVVKLTNKSGQRVTVPVASLVSKAFVAKK